MKINYQENQSFKESIKQIRLLLLEEKRTKETLEEIQKTKLECIRILFDGKYCEKILKEMSK